jgi:hypothetical protein
MKLETVWTVLIAVKARAFASRVRGKKRKNGLCTGRLRRRKDDLGEDRARAALPLLQDLPYIGP